MLVCGQQLFYLEYDTTVNNVWENNMDGDRKYHCISNNNNNNIHISILPWVVNSEAVNLIVRCFSHVFSVTIYSCAFVCVPFNHLLPFFHATVPRQLVSLSQVKQLWSKPGASWWRTSRIEPLSSTSDRRNLIDRWVLLLSVVHSVPYSGLASNQCATVKISSFTADQTTTPISI